MKLRLSPAFCKSLMEMEDIYLKCLKCPGDFDYLPCTGGLNITYPNPKGLMYFYHEHVLELKTFLESPLDVLAEALYGTSCGCDNEKALNFINLYLKSGKQIHSFIFSARLEPYDLTPLHARPPIP